MAILIFLLDFHGGIPADDEFVGSRFLETRSWFGPKQRGERNALAGSADRDLLPLRSGVMLREFMVWSVTLGT